MARKKNNKPTSHSDSGSKENACGAAGSANQAQFEKSNSYGGNPNSSSFDELVAPPSSVVHPSAGVIPRRDMEVIVASNRDLQASVEANLNSVNSHDVRSSATGQGTSINISIPHVEEPRKEGWANLFDGEKLAAKGQKLKFVAPLIKDGKHIAKLQQPEIDHMTKKWEAALVFYVVGYTPTIAAVNRYIAKEWNHIQKPLVFLHDDGFFVVQCMSVADKDEILFEGPHMFNGKPVIVKSCSASFNFHEEVLKLIPIWVRFPNLPLSFWGPDSLSRIGSLLGDPMYADECTSNQLRVSFARVLIEIDVTVPLVNSVQIEDGQGNMLDQKVVYDWQPLYCHTCKVVGHSCRKKATKQKEGVVRQKWVPKNPTNQGVEDHSVAQQSTKEGNQGEIFQTPALERVVVHSDDDGANWKEVTWKTKGRRKERGQHSVSNSYSLLVGDILIEDVEKEDEDEPPAVP